MDGGLGGPGLARHGPGQAPAEDEKVAAAPAAAAASFDFLAVPEDEPWTAAVAAPVAGPRAGRGQIPLLIVLSSPPTREAEELVELAAPNLPLVLAAAAAPKLGRALAKRSPEVLVVGSDPVKGSFLVAKRFWERPRRAVVAAADDAEGILLGSAPGGPVGDAAALAGAFGEPRVAREGLAGVGRRGGLGGRCRRRPRPAMDQFRGQYNIKVAAPRAVQDRIIKAIGPRKIPTIVVARVPEKRAAVGATAWLAPYLGLVRNAPLALSHAPSAALAEAEVGRLIAAGGLRPRTITILADYDSLGDNVVEIDPGVGAGCRLRPRPTAAAETRPSTD